MDDGEGWQPPEDERRTRLGDVATAGSTFEYVYDFGDNGRHKVVVEKLLPAQSDVRYPLCTDGRRAGPPEDCGGTWGYRDFLVAIADPAHEEHEAMLEWAGGAFDPEAFDPGEFKERLHLGRLSALWPPGRGQSVQPTPKMLPAGADENRAHLPAERPSPSRALALPRRWGS